MVKQASVAAAAALAATLLGPVPARAEVGVETDPMGNYLRTVVYASTSRRQVRVWAVQRVRPLSFPLNRHGDVLRDSWPTIVENPATSRWPWVFWSRPKGDDRDLVFSRWLGSGWSDVAWVEPALGAGDDLDPSAGFDASGKPYLAWWRDERGTGRVYLTWFASGRWSGALLLSDPGVDSRYPVLTVLADGTVRVDFQTPQGPATVFVSFPKPLTITDDLAPVGMSPPPPPKGGSASGS